MLRTEWRAAVALLLLCVGCKQPPPKPQAPPPVATIRATVVTIQTKVEPGERTLTHTLTIANDRARMSDELDMWRLYDLKGNRVTFVDEIAKNTRTETFDALLQARRKATAKPLAAELTRAAYVPTAETKVVAGVPTTRVDVRLAGYERQLWVGRHPNIPPQLFALMHVSTPPSSPYAPIMRDVDEKLAAVRGFPMIDRAELTYGNRKMLVERTVVSIAQKDVPKF